MENKIYEKLVEESDVIVKKLGCSNVDEALIKLKGDDKNGKERTRKISKKKS